MSKKILLVGSSYSAIPILFYLKSLNYLVAVCGSIKDDPCHKYADYSFNIDYSDKEQLLALVTEHKFEYMIPSCNDYAYMSAAWVAERLDLPGYDDFETTVILHTKDKFRQVMHKFNLPVPSTVDMQSVEENYSLLEFPLLVKPVDGFSGRGVAKVKNRQELTFAIQEAQNSSINGQVVIERFLDGSLHSHSAFIVDGKIIFDVFADEYCTVYPYQVNCSNIPSYLSVEVLKSVRDVMQKMVDLLKINDGLLHTQFMVENEKAWIIECMRRCPGDLYNKMVQDATGIEYLSAYIAPYLNMKIPEYKQKFEKYIARHTVSVDENQDYFSFSHVIPADTTEIVTLKLSGEILDKAPYDKLGITFSEFSSLDSLIEHAGKLEKYIKIMSIGN